MAAAIRSTSVASSPSPMMSATATMILPQPNESFHWTQGNAGPFLVCRPLEAIAPHLFTTRPWEIGSAASLAPSKGWNEVAAAIGVAERDLVRVRQVHGAAVHLHGPRGTRRHPGVD